jgi:hypothetical protein
MLEPLEITRFCNDNGISIEELLLIYRVLTSNNARKKDEQLRIEFEKYKLNNKHTVDYKKLTDLLVEKGLLINNNHKGVYIIKNIIITDKFLELIYVDRDKCFLEVLAVYPHNFNINGSIIPTLTFKGGTNLLKDKYYNDILKGGSSSLHKRFIAITTDYFKGKQFAQHKLSDYIDNFEVFAFMEEHKKPIINETTRR